MLGASVCLATLQLLHGITCAGVQGVALDGSQQLSWSVMPLLLNAASFAQVPMDQPKHALDMITRFTRSEDFGARASAHLVTAGSGTASSSAAAA